MTEICSNCVARTITSPPPTMAAVPMKAAGGRSRRRRLNSHHEPRPSSSRLVAEISSRARPTSTNRNRNLTGEKAAVWALAMWGTPLKISSFQNGRWPARSSRNV